MGHGQRSCCSGNTAGARGCVREWPRASAARNPGQHAQVALRRHSLRAVAARSRGNLQRRARRVLPAGHRQVPRGTPVAKPKPPAVPSAGGKSLYSVVLLAVFAVVLSLIFGASNPAPAPTVPPLPPTQPGSGHDEGWFLFTTADDGSRAVYFIAGNTRHSILPGDVQLELQVNPLW